MSIFDDYDSSNGIQGPNGIVDPNPTRELVTSTTQTMFKPIELTINLTQTSNFAKLIEFLNSNHMNLSIHGDEIVVTSLKTYEVARFKEL